MRDGTAAAFPIECVINVAASFVFHHGVAAPRRFK